jgi:hypothetical protein
MIAEAIIQILAILQLRVIISLVPLGIAIYNPTKRKRKEKTSASVFIVFVLSRLIV